MANSTSTSRRTIGIVGGGLRGAHLLDLFHGSSLTQVVYVVDPNAQAQGMVAARAAGVPTYSAVEAALAAFQADFVFEMTGVAEVAELLAQKLSHSDTRLFTHEMAAVVQRVIEEHDQQSKDQVVADILGIRTEIKQSLAGMEQLVGTIKEISAEMIMLALNARIEAARAGEHGRGFAVVAQKMADSVTSIQTVTQEFEKASANLLMASDKIEAALSNLK
jgi:hypothetical protein